MANFWQCAPFPFWDLDWSRQEVPQPPSMLLSRARVEAASYRFVQELLSSPPQPNEHKKEGDCVAAAYFRGRSGEPSSLSHSQKAGAAGRATTANGMADVALERQMAQIAEMLSKLGLVPSPRQLFHQSRDALSKSSFQITIHDSLTLE